MISIIFALLPLLSILFLLFILKKSSIFTGITTLVLTLLLAVSPLFHTSIQVLHEPIIKSLLTTSIIVYILFFGILLYQLMEQSQAISKFAQAITASTDDQVYQILLLALGLSPLIEAVSGFGLAVIVIAPLLIALGFSPMKSALIALASLTIIPWGTLALGTIIGATLSNLPIKDLGIGSSLLTLPLYLYFTMIVIFIGVGKKQLVKRLPFIVTVGIVFGGAVWLSNRFFSVELAGIFAPLLLMILLFIRMRLQNPFAILRHLLPYFLLMCLLFISRILPTFSDFLRHNVVINVKKYDFQLAVLYSPGFFLIVVGIFTIIFYRLNIQQVKKSLLVTFQKSWPVILTTLLFISISEIMTTANMINLLAQTAASFFGSFYLFIAPLIGASGGFLTGSNTASNSMFIRLQTETASQVGLSPVLVASAQNVSSSFFTMVNPSRVTLSTTISAIPQHENTIQKQIAFIAIGTLTIILLELIIAFFILY